MAYGFENIDYDPFEDEEEDEEKQQARTDPMEYGFKNVDYDPFEEEDQPAIREVPRPDIAGEVEPGYQVPEPVEEEREAQEWMPAPGPLGEPMLKKDLPERPITPFEQAYQEEMRALEGDPEADPLEAELRAAREAEEAGEAPAPADVDPETGRPIIPDTEPWRWEDAKKDLKAWKVERKEREKRHQNNLNEAKKRILKKDPAFQFPEGEGPWVEDPRELHQRKRGLDPTGKEIDWDEKAERDLTGEEGKSFANQFASRMVPGGYTGVRRFEQGVYTMNYYLWLASDTEHRRVLDSVVDQLSKGAFPEDIQKQEAYKVRFAQEASDMWGSGYIIDDLIMGEAEKHGVSLKEDPLDITTYSNPPENMEEVKKKNVERIKRVTKGIEDFHKKNPEYALPDDWDQLDQEEQELKYPGIFWGDMVSTNVINSILSIGTYATVQAATKNATVATLAAGLVLYPTFVQEIDDELKRLEREEGIVVDERVRAELTLLGAAPSAMIEGLSERLGFGPGTMKHFKSLGKKALKREMIKRLVQSAVAKKTYTFAGKPTLWTVKQGMAGYGEEAGQQMVSNAAAQVVGSERSLMQGVPEAGRIGFYLEPVLGGPMKAAEQAGRIVKERRAKKKAYAAEEQIKRLLQEEGQIKPTTAEGLLLDEDLAPEADAERAAEHIRETIYKGAESVEAEEAGAEFTPEQLAAAAAEVEAEPAAPPPRAPMPTARARMGEPRAAQVGRIWGVREKAVGGPRVAPVRTEPPWKLPAKPKPAQVAQVKEIWKGKRAPRPGGLIERVSVPPAKTRITPTTKRKLFQGLADDMGKKAGAKIRFDNIVYQNERPVGLQMKVTSGPAKGARFFVSDRQKMNQVQGFINTIVKAYKAETPGVEEIAPKKKAAGSALQKEFDDLVGTLNDEQRKVVKDLIEWTDMPIDQRLGLMRAELATLETKKELKAAGPPRKIVTKPTPPPAEAPPAPPVRPKVEPGEVLAPTTDVPGPSPGDRWATDPGSMPGEPLHYLDVEGDDFDTAKAAIVEHEVEDGSLFELVGENGETLGMFKSASEAATEAEKRIKAPPAAPVVPGGPRVAPVRTVPSVPPAEVEEAPVLPAGPAEVGPRVAPVRAAPPPTRAPMPTERPPGRVAPIRTGVGVEPAADFEEYGVEGFTYRKEGPFNYRVYDPKGNQVADTFRSAVAAQGFIDGAEVEVAAPEPGDLTPAGPPKPPPQEAEVAAPEIEGAADIDAEIENLSDAEIDDMLAEAGEEEVEAPAEEPAAPAVEKTLADRIRAGEVALKHSALKKFTKPELVQAATDLGIDATGNKGPLILRLTQEGPALVEVTEAPAPEEIEPAGPPVTPPKKRKKKEPVPTKELKDIVAEAGKAGLEGADEALKGLHELFGGGRVVGMGVVFDEDTYAQAKPHFQSAYEKIKASGKSLKDLFNFVVEQFGAKVKPYIRRFVKETKAAIKAAKAALGNFQNIGYVYDPEEIKNGIAGKAPKTQVRIIADKMAPGKIWNIAHPEGTTHGLPRMMKAHQELFTSFKEFVEKRAMLHRHSYRRVRKWETRVENWMDAGHTIEELQDLATEYGKQMERVVNSYSKKTNILSAATALQDKFLEGFKNPDGSFKDFFDIQDQLTAPEWDTDYSKSGRNGPMYNFLTKNWELYLVEENDILLSEIDIHKRTRNKEVIRTGLPDYRKGKTFDDTEAFNADFNFKGVGFGTQGWINQEERHRVVHAAYDSFRDLATVIGANNQGMSLGNELAIQFANLGHKARGAAAAYFPTIQTINFTRDNGDGTLAHEWGHGFDYLLTDRAKIHLQSLVESMMHKYDFEAGVRMADDLMQPDSRFMKKVVDTKKQSRIDYIKDEVKARYEDAVRKETDYYATAKQIDPDYTARQTEMWARALEAYVYDNLGGTNNYLVNDFVAAGRIGGKGRVGESSLVYPTGGEREQFNEDIAHYFDGLEWDENGVASLKDDYVPLEDNQEVRLQEGLNELLDQIEERYKAIWSSEPSADGKFWYRYDATALGPMMQPDGYVAFDKEFKQEDQDGQGAVGYLTMIHPDDIIGYKLTNIQYDGENATEITPEGGEIGAGQPGEEGEQALEEVPTGADGGIRERGDVRPGDKERGEPGERGGREPGKERGEDRHGEGDSPGGVHPATAGNYRITDEALNEPLPVADRFNSNLAAIRVLREVEDADRSPTDAEKDILAGYTGWGGMAELFSYDPSSAWRSRSELIKAELSREELTEAERSAVSSYYTPVPVARFMWKLAQRLGFKNGLVLDPAFGANGVFTGTMPDELRTNASVLGVEKDNLSSRIASKLYEQAKIENLPFEDSKKPLNRFQFTVTNVPFANYSPTDKKHNKAGHKIHNYYINKMLDLTAPGGLSMAIATSRTMDSGGPHLAEYAKKADLVGAIRLPSDLYSATGVTTDILVFRKKIEGSEFEGAPVDDWTGADTHDSGLEINNYFLKHPDMIAGSVEKVQGRYGDDRIRVVREADNIDRVLADKAATFPEDIVETEVAAKELTLDDMISAPGTVKEGGLYVNAAGKLAKSEDGQEVLMPNKTPKEKRAVNVGKQFVKLLDDVRVVLRLQKENASDAEVANAQRQLKTDYNAFVKKFGAINHPDNQKILIFVTDSPWVLALEEYDPDDDKVTKLADIFTKKIVGTEKRPDFANTDHEALNMALDEFGYPNVDFMAKLRNADPDTVLKGITDRVIENPETGILETMDEYLSGNVRRKLAVAEDMARSNPEYERNVTLLQAALPDEIPPHRITARIGASWLLPQHLTDFVKEKINIGSDLTPIFNFNAATHLWTLSYKGRERWKGEVKAETQRAIDKYKKSVESKSKWGTPRMHFFELMGAAISGHRPIVQYMGEDRKMYIDEVATAGAEAKLVEIQNEFQRWLFADTERAEEATGRFNLIVNTSTTSNYDGSHLTFPGKSMAVLTAAEAKELGVSDEMVFYDHQVNATWQYLRNGNIYLAHEVGAGKTMTMAMIAMEAKRLKGKKKILYVTLNDSTMGQAVEEIKTLYPLANIMPIQVSTKAQRARRELNKMAVNDFDIAIMRQDDLNRIELSPEASRLFIEEELQELRAALEDAKAEGAYITEADIQTRILAAEAKLQEPGVFEEAKEEQTIYFDDIGVDLMIVDEAHNYKNIPYATSLNRITGLNPSGSKTAGEFFRKTQWLNATYPKQDGVVLASGTPLTNSIGEFFNLQRVLQPTEAKRQGQWRFDRWIANYGDIGTQLEWDGARQEFKDVTTNKRIVNAGRLLATAFQNIDSVRAEDTNIARPDIKGGKPTPVSVQPNKYVQHFQETVLERLAELERNPKEALYEGRPDNMLRIISNMSAVAIDQRLLTSKTWNEATEKWDPAPGPYADTEMQEDSKIYQASRMIYKRWKEEKKHKGVQLVFADMGIPGRYAKKFKYLEDDDLAKKSVEQIEEYNTAKAEYEGSAALGFNTYDAITDELVKLGMPREEIAYIHDADHANKVKKAGNLRKLYKKVNSGQVRVLFGSTKKAGTGVNVQERVSDVHHLDVWWNFSDYEQRNGRALRAGNKYIDWGGVAIHNYITEHSVDAHRWGRVFSKGKVLHTALSGDINIDIVEDITEAVQTAKETEAIASGNPLMKKQADLLVQTRTLGLERSSFLDTVRDAKMQLAQMPQQILNLETRIEQHEKSLGIMEPITAVRFGGSQETLVLKKDGKKIATALAAAIETTRPAKGNAWYEATKEEPLLTFGTYTEKEVEQPVVDDKGKAVKDKAGKAKTKKVKERTFQPAVAQAVMQSNEANNFRRWMVIRNGVTSSESILAEFTATKKPAESSANVSRALTSMISGLEGGIQDARELIEEYKGKRPGLEEIAESTWPKVDELEQAEKDLTEIERQMAESGTAAGDPTQGAEISRFYKAPVPVLEDFAGKKDWYHTTEGQVVYPKSGEEFSIALNRDTFDVPKYFGEHRKKFKTSEQYYGRPEQLELLTGVADATEPGNVIERPKLFTTIKAEADERPIGERAEPILEDTKFWVHDGPIWYSINPTSWQMIDRMVGAGGEWQLHKWNNDHYMVWVDPSGFRRAMIKVNHEQRVPKGIKESAKEPDAGEPAAMARKIKPVTPLSVDAVKLYTEATRVGWARTGPGFRIHATQDALMKAVPEAEAHLKSGNRDGDIIAGAYFDNTIHLVAEHLGSPEEVIETILHEGFGHHGIRGTLGKSIIPVMRDLYIAKRKEVDAIADDLGIDTATPEGRIKAAEEWFAQQAQLETESKWFDRLVRAIKNWIRKVKIPLRISDAEIRALIANARQFTETGRRVSAYPGEAPAFSQRIRKPKTSDKKIEWEENLTPKQVKRIKKARGVGSESWLARRKEELRRLRAERQHFPELQRVEDETLRHQLADILRVHQEIPEVAKQKTAEVMRDFIKDLSPDAYDVYTMNIIFADMIRDVESGLLVNEMLGKDETLPFGFQSTEEIEEAYSKFQGLAKIHPEIGKALNTRKAYIDNMTQQLVKYKILKKEVLKHKDYYHHQVLQYWGTKEEKRKGVATGSADVRTHWRPWMAARKGSLLDYNTEYVEAEFVALSQQTAQLATAKTLERIKGKADIYADLKDEAKSLNYNNFYDLTAKDLTEQLKTPITAAEVKTNKDLDPLDKYRKKIAMGMSGLEKMAADGAIGGDSEFDDIIQGLADDYAAKKEAKAEGIDAPPSGVPDGRYFDFLAYLVRTQQPGANWAATIFKNIHARRKQIKDYLESKNKFITWRHRIPEGYDEWKPDPGKGWYWANTLADSVLQQVIAGERDLQDEDVRQTLAKGQEIIWVLPEGLIDTLDNFKQPVEMRAIGRMSETALRAWKQYILINPVRVLKYNMNNMSGDLDITLAYNPKILKYFIGSTRDLWKWGKGTASDEIKGELDLSRKLGVIGSGWSVQEVDDITKQMGLDKFVRNVIMGQRPNLAMKYWQTAKNATTFRENILRLAAFRHFRKEIAKGKDVYGASKPPEVDAIEDPTEKAAKLARELVGDYGNISHSGQWIRKRMMPFYSWMEINTPRYVYMMRNVKHEGRKPGHALSRLGIKGMTKTALYTGRAMMLYTAIQISNNLFFPDEEEEFGKAGRRQLHLILGRRADGSIRSIRFQGALSDMLSFYDLEDFPEDFKDVARGDKTIQDKLLDVPKAFGTRFYHAIRPEPKIVGEALSGYSFYPDPLSPRPIRDTAEHILRTFSLDMIYRRLAGKPGRGKTMAEHFYNDLKKLVFYTSDPGEQAYYDVRNMVYEYKKATGDEMPSGKPTNKGNALYYYRQALKYGDFKAAEKYLYQYYFKYKGTTQGLRRSIEKAHPLGGIKKIGRHKFRNSMTPADKKTLDRAMEWYRRHYKGTESREIRIRAKQRALKEKFANR